VAATADETFATADETLADEQRRRVQAGVAAIAAGVLTIGGGVIAAVVYSDLPSVPLLDALRERLNPVAPAESLKARQVLFYHDNAFKLIAVSLVLALAAATIGVALSHLYRSTKARRPELPKAAVIAAIAGAVCVAVAGVAQAAGVTIEAGAFADSANRSPQAARDALNAPLVIASLFLRQVGVFALGLAFVLLSLNAMRVGLLTRFMGVLGIIVGVLFIVPLGSSLPIVQAFWLIALGALFLGYWPPGRPPAWATGEAQPWPTQQEIREARLAQRAESGGGDSGKSRSRNARETTEPAPRLRKERAEAPETPAPEAPKKAPHPSSKKKKRKRRA
jgi:F0F1-type ATP synthase membrane subunit c/vacuolar-type H+-ATPase subunit K